MLLGRGRGRKDLLGCPSTWQWASVASLLEQYLPSYVTLRRYPYWRQSLPIKGKRTVPLPLSLRVTPLSSTVDKWPSCAKEVSESLPLLLVRSSLELLLLLLLLELLLSLTPPILALLEGADGAGGLPSATPPVLAPASAAGALRVAGRTGPTPVMSRSDSLSKSATLPPS